MQVAVCDIYAIVIKRCPSYSRHVTALLPLAYVPEIVHKVSSCIQLSLATIGAGSIDCKSDSVEGEALIENISGAKPEELNVLGKDNDSSSPEVICNEAFESARRKRRKLSGGKTAEKAENSLVKTTEAVELLEEQSVLGGHVRSINVLVEQESVCSADLVCKELLQMMDTIGPVLDVLQDTSVENRLAALHVIVKVFKVHPTEVGIQRSIKLFQEWVSWILHKVRELVVFVISKFCQVNSFTNSLTYISTE